MLRSAWRTVPPAANRCESWFRRGCATATPPAFVAVEGSSNELLSSIDLSLRWRECYEVLLPRQRLSPWAVLASYRGLPGFKANLGSPVSGNRLSAGGIDEFHQQRTPDQRESGQQSECSKIDL